ncbi:hypothetical protein D3C81_1767110 [compost metagenome]
MPQWRHRRPLSIVWIGTIQRGGQSIERSGYQKVALPFLATYPLLEMLFVDGHISGSLIRGRWDLPAANAQAVRKESDRGRDGYLRPP